MTAASIKGLRKRAQRALPFMLGLVGFAGMFLPKGQITAAGPAAAEVLCFGRGRSLAADPLARAQALGSTTLFLTLDTDISLIRERDTQNSFRTAARLGWRGVMDMESIPAGASGWPANAVLNWECAPSPGPGRRAHDSGLLSRGKRGSEPDLGRPGMVARALERTGCPERYPFGSGRRRRANGKG
jgi:FMN-dependent dehydrogenase